MSVQYKNLLCQFLIRKQELQISFVKRQVLTTKIDQHCDDRIYKYIFHLYCELYQWEIMSTKRRLENNCIKSFSCYINFLNRWVHSAGRTSGGVSYHRGVCDLTVVNIVVFHCLPVFMYCIISLPSFSISTCKYWKQYVLRLISVIENSVSETWQLFVKHCFLKMSA